MRTLLLTFALALALSACTGGDAEAPGSAGTPTGSTTAASESEPAEGEPRTDGPLQLDDSRGKACASLTHGREYTAWEHNRTRFRRRCA